MFGGERLDVHLDSAHLLVYMCTVTDRIISWSISCTAWYIWLIARCSHNLCLHVRWFGSTESEPSAGAGQWGSIRVVATVVHELVTIPSTPSLDRNFPLLSWHHGNSHVKLPISSSVFFFLLQFSSWLMTFWTCYISQKKMLPFLLSLTLFWELLLLTSDAAQQLKPGRAQHVPVHHPKPGMHTRKRMPAWKAGSWSTLMAAQQGEFILRPGRPIWERRTLSAPGGS
jgi:hypothetical protein